MYENVHGFLSPFFYYYYLPLCHSAHAVVDDSLRAHTHTHTLWSGLQQ